MERKPGSWLRRRAKGHDGPNRHATAFRSDDDLRRWLAGLRLGVPLTMLSVSLLLGMGLPFRSSPVAVAPAVLLIAWLEVRAWRDRRLGRRQDDYLSDDLS